MFCYVIGMSQVYFMRRPLYGIALTPEIPNRVNRQSNQNPSQIHSTFYTRSNKVCYEYKKNCVSDKNSWGRELDECHAGSARRATGNSHFPERACAKQVQLMPDVFQGQLTFNMLRAISIAQTKKQQLFSRYILMLQEETLDTGNTFTKSDH